jgi:hypothetical protein
VANAAAYGAAAVNSLRELLVMKGLITSAENDTLEEGLKPRIWKTQHDADEVRDVDDVEWEKTGW